MSAGQPHPTRPASTNVTAIKSRGIDDALLERVADGEPDALGALFDRLGPTVHGLALRTVRDRSLAEDVTQDVFLDVWLKAAQFDRSRGGARTWILTIAHRRAVDVVRREQSGRDRVARSTSVIPQRGYDMVSEEVVDRVAAVSADQELGRAMEKLTKLQRTAIELAYFGGLTYAQVAERLDIPVPTAKTRIRDGLKRLAGEITPMSHDEGASARTEVRSPARSLLPRRAAS